MIVGMVRYRITSILHHCFPGGGTIDLLCLYLTEPALRRGFGKPGLPDLTEPGTDLDFKHFHLGFSIHS